ncbi:hypothetical protein SO802_021620, partial [Lithocarpus litseifolius]
RGKKEINHDKNGKIDKIVVETAMMKKKMEKTQQTFCKTQGMDDFLYTMGGLGSTTLVPLPPKFKIFYAAKFDGSARMKGLDEKQALCAYVSHKNASRWYYNLDGGVALNIPQQKGIRLSFVVQ